MKRGEIADLPKSENGIKQLSPLGAWKKRVIDDATDKIAGWDTPSNVAKTAGIVVGVLTFAAVLTIHFVAKDSVVDLYCIIASWLFFSTYLSAKAVSFTKEERAAVKQDTVALAEHIAEEVDREETEIMQAVSALLNEKSQSSPWLAEQFADYIYLIDSRTAMSLRYKAHPAVRASEEVAQISREKRELQKECKRLQYQIGFYEAAFPWLEEFKELPPAAAFAYARDTGTDDEYQTLKDWLSPEEYAQLPSAEKYQRALNRYQRREKTAWEVGVDFERYYGYLLEQRGYKVQYCGALLGLEDMGRDLVATLGDECEVIQCKRWAKEKTIHEKHIFQLYGSVVMLSIQDPKHNYKGVFVTTTVLSDTARKCADFLGITAVENFPIADYPVIKCNIGRGKEKIYHLPMDQQYDKVSISKKDGAFYAWTTKEAEANGFRRAYRWRGPNRAKS